MKKEFNVQNFSKNVEDRYLDPEKIRDRAILNVEEKEKIEGKDRFDFAVSLFSRFIENSLGEKGGDEIDTSYGDENFLERSTEEQEDILFRIYNLNAQKRDLGRSLRLLESEDLEDEKRRRFKIKILKGGRRVKVPVSEDIYVNRNSYEDKAIKNTKEKIQSIKNELQSLGTIPGVREVYLKKLVVFYFEMRANEKVQKLRTRNEEIRAEIEFLKETSSTDASGTVSGVFKEQIKLLEDEFNKNENTINNQRDFEGHDELARLQQIGEYRDSYSEGRMIEIPSMKRLVDEGMMHMRNHQPFWFAGHLGSGKTEIAKHIAKLFMLENLDSIEGTNLVEDDYLDPDKIYNKMKPEFFSGGDEASVYDLVGKLKLKGKGEVPTEELKTRIDELSKKLEEVGIVNIPNEKIAEILLGKSDVTETVFHYGPLGRALKRGVPLIIDEINMIPSEVISRINDILTRKVGDSVILQENGEEAFEIKPGFTVLATFNLGHQYEGVKEVNAAFKSRWVAKEVFYPEMSETYDLILAALIRKDRLTLPSSFPINEFEKLVDLTIVTHEIQELFSGKTEGQRFMAMINSVSAEKAQLDKSVISVRDLLKKIIDPWKSGNFSESLDEIIARNILGSEVFSVDDQKFMTEMFIRRGFFKDWTEERLKEYGITNVSQHEINVLNSVMNTEEYVKSNEKYNVLKKELNSHSNLSRSLSIGVVE